MTASTTGAPGLAADTEESSGFVLDSVDVPDILHTFSATVTSSW